MIATLLRIEWLNLKRDRIALAIVFVLPIIFFSIFAAIFSNMGGGAEAKPISVIVIDEDHSEVSERFVSAMMADDGLRVAATTNTGDDPIEQPFTREQARKLVRDSTYAAVVILPQGFGEHFARFDANRDPIEVIFDPTNPYAGPGVTGLLQGIGMQSAPDLLMERGLEYLDEWGGGLTDEQRRALDFIRPYLRGEKPWSELDERVDDEATTPSDDAPFRGLVPVNAISVKADEGDEAEPSMIAYYAAGIGVMFLLFSMAGAAGSIIKEEETGSLDRVLSSNISISTLLASKWMFFGLIGALQVMLMFVWGELVFGGMHLFRPNRLVGFLVMTLFTAGAASAFGIMMASFCRTRGQLDGISTIVVLIMSALGGSMVPRFLMPDFMRNIGLFTFNGHALDGFLKVFWKSTQDASIGSVVVGLLPQLVILIAMGTVFFMIARLMARRWEST